VEITNNNEIMNMPPKLSKKLQALAHAVEKKRKQVATKLAEAAIVEKEAVKKEAASGKKDDGAASKSNKKVDSESAASGRKKVVSSARNNKWKRLKLVKSNHIGYQPMQASYEMVSIKKGMPVPRICAKPSKVSQGIRVNVGY